MKSKLTVFVCCLLFQFARGGDSLISFHGCRIQLPTGFTALSKGQLTEFRNTVFDRQIMNVYENKSNGIQRFIIYYDSLTGTNNLTFEQIVEIKFEVLKENGVDFNVIEINRQNHCAYGKSILFGDTSIFGFSVDNNGILGLQFDNSKGINDIDLRNFERTLQTIRHEHPYHFIANENPRTENAKKEMKDSGITLIIAFLAMIFIWGIRKFVIMKK